VFNVAVAMPQIFKRPGRPCYYARWQHGGQDFLRSTGETDRKKALAKLNEMVAEHRGELEIEDIGAKLLKLLDALPKEQQPETRQAWARRILGGQENKLELAKGWTAWRANANREYEPKASTLAGYEAIWKRFANWAKDRSLQFFHEVQPADAEAYGANLWASKVSPATFNAHIKFLRSAFGALELQAGLGANPWSRLKTKQKTPGEGRRNLSMEELQIVMARAEGNLRLMLAIGLFTGMRLGDVVNLRWDCLDFDRGLARIVPKKTERYGKVVEVPLRGELIGSLREHQRSNGDSEFILPKERAEHAANAGNLTVRIQRFFESCKIQTTEEPQHGHRQRAIVRVGFHSLRHSFVSLCAKAGTPMHVVQKLVGRGNPMLTAGVYTHVDNAQHRAAMESLPDLRLMKGR
jgi:integrase